MAETDEPTGGLRERNKAAKRARILAAARELLASEGYDAMTMAQVARRADVAIGTVFQYAATKPELLMMVTADTWAGVAPTLLAGAEDEPAASAVRRLLTPLLQTSLQDPENTAAIARELLFGAPGPHRDAVVAIVADLEAAVTHVLRDAGVGERAEAAARLTVSGGLLELNRTRTGRATPESAAARLDALIDIVVSGAAAGGT